MYDNNKIQGGGSYLQPGIYNVFIFDHKFDNFTNANGEEVSKVTVRFKCEEGMHYEDFLLKESTKWRLKNLSIAAGISATGTWDFQDILGKEIKIRIIKETYKGKERSKISEMVQINDTSLTGKDIDSVDINDDLKDEEKYKPISDNEHLYSDDPF